MIKVNLDLHSNKHLKNIFCTNCIVAVLYAFSFFLPVVFVLYFFKISLYYKYKDLAHFYPNDLKEYNVSHNMSDLDEDSSVVEAEAMDISEDDYSEDLESAI